MVQTATIVPSTGTWTLLVFDNQRSVYEADLTGAVEIGRQSEAHEKVYSCNRTEPGRTRVVIAHKEENFISRSHLLLEPQADGRFKVTNLSRTGPFRMPDGTPLPTNASGVISSGALLALGSKAVRLVGEESEHPLEALADATLPPGHETVANPFPHLPTFAVAGVEIRAVIHWLRSCMDVLQSAATTPDFFDKAAKAMVEMVRLDSGRILTLEEDSWHTRAEYTAPWIRPSTKWAASRGILRRARNEKRTFWEVPGLSTPNTDTLRGVGAVVVAPILDRQGNVIGVLYGDRRHDGTAAVSGPITELEAMLVDLLARGVAAGLARLEQEQKALAARVQFAQFFTEELASELAANPTLLVGRDAEVSLLFCDVRRFSHISEKLGPTATMDWIGEVMGVLSSCVHAHQGVLVDYIGDELLAMWGAPKDQPDHAQLACRAALDMVARLPELNEHWQPIFQENGIQESMCFGIGINTGIARIGNTGSHLKFKYGPLGNTVNLASRVQGATKHLKCNLLITGATQAKLDATFATRRLARVKVVNIAAEVDLHELAVQGHPDWPGAREEYENALEEFENQQFRESARRLGNWRAQHPDDRPALLLLARAVNCMVEEPSPFDPVWELPGK